MEYGETEKQKEFNNNNDSGAENGSVKDPEIPVRHGWEINLSKLIIKSMIARGTFGIVHRVVYDGLDVAVKLLDWGEDQKTAGENASFIGARLQWVQQHLLYNQKMVIRAYHAMYDSSTV